MSDKSVSDAVRHLEQLRDEGFLSEEQFGREVRDLLKRREAEDLAVKRVAPAVRLKGSGLGDMVVHSQPVEYDETVVVIPEPLAAEGLKLERDDSPPDVLASMPHLLSSPPPSLGPKEAGRVVISGKVPWDNKGGERIGLDGGTKLDKEEKAADPTNALHRPMDPITREYLARMAARTNRILNKTKNPEVAFLLSLLLPGLGHVYFGRLGVGVLLMLLGGAGWMGVLFEEYWVLYILAPMGLLSAALVHRGIQMHNRYIDMKNMADARRAPTASRLNVEKAIREAGARAPAARR
ncbi:MAG: hypothetical protein KKE73_06780 [Proteobacteria bacterium]|nr:hypothetical protein [Pseudomonadota bacterium]